MNPVPQSHFDQAAATWDDNPMRIVLMKAVGQAILREARPTKDMDVLDYGCGTGLVGLYLLPSVRSVTGADNSAGMLGVLREKITDGGLENMQTMRLDLEHDPLPAGRYDLIVSSMALHHIADTAGILRAFYQLLHPPRALVPCRLGHGAGSVSHARHCDQCPSPRVRPSRIETTTDTRRLPQRPRHHGPRTAQAGIRRRRTRLPCVLDDRNQGTEYLNRAKDQNL
jgi:SAM-dependent methyltransferase